MTRAAPRVGRLAALAAILLLASAGVTSGLGDGRRLLQSSNGTAAAVTAAAPDGPDFAEPMAYPVWGGIGIEAADDPEDNSIERGLLDAAWETETVDADVNLGFTIQGEDGPESVLSVVTNPGGSLVLRTKSKLLDASFVLVMDIRGDFDPKSLELQISSSLHSNFTYPSIPFDQLTASDMSYPSEGWTRVALPAAPFLNIWGNASLPFGTFDTVTIRDTDLCGDGTIFFIRDFALVEAQPTPEEAQILAEGLASLEVQPAIQTEAFLDTAFSFVCRRYRLFWCSSAPAPTPSTPLPPLPGPLPGSPGVPALSLSAYGRTGNFRTGMRTVTVIKSTLGTFPAAVYYPASGGSVASGRFPVVCFGKGSGTQSFLYRSTLVLLASHGFIVVAPDSSSLFNGKDMVESMLYVQRMNDVPGNFLFGKIDTVAGFGTTGHSMGGGGAISAAASDSARRLNIRASAPVHPAPWSGGGVGAPAMPMLIMAGALDTTTQASLIKSRIYDIRSSYPKIMATMRTAPHNEQVDWIGLKRWSGYMVAWFRLYLKGETAIEPIFWDARGNLRTDSRMSSVLVKI